MATSNLGELVVKIAGDTGDISKKLDDLGGRLDKLGRAAQQSSGGFVKWALNVTGVNQALELAGKLIDPLADGIKFLGDKTLDAIKASADHETQIARLNAALEASGQFTETYSSELEALAESIAKVAGVSAESVINIERLLVSFGAAPAQVESLTQSVLDLSAGLGIDAQSAAQAFGKALQGNFSALTRLGVVADEAGRKADELGRNMETLRGKFGPDVASAAEDYARAFVDIRRGYGDTSKASSDLQKRLDSLKSQFNSAAAGAIERYALKAAKVSDAYKRAAASGLTLAQAQQQIEARLGGQAAAQAQTFAGRINAVSSAYGDLLRAAGDVITQNPRVAGALQAAGKAFDDLAKRINDNRGGLDGVFDAIFGGAIDGAKRAATAVEDFGKTFDFPLLTTAAQAIQQFLGGIDEQAKQVAEPIQRIGNLFTNVDQSLATSSAAIKTWGEQAKEAFASVSGSFTNDIQKKLGEGVDVKFAFPTAADVGTALGALSPVVIKEGARLGADFLTGFTRGFTERIASSLFGKDFTDKAFGALDRAAEEGKKKLGDKLLETPEEFQKRFELDLRLNSEEAEQKADALERNLDGLLEKYRGGIKLSLDDSQVQSRLAALNTALDDLRRSVTIPVTLNEVGFETSYQNVALRLASLRQPVVIPVGFQQTGGGAGGANNIAVPEPPKSGPGSPTATGAAAGTAWGTAWAASAAGQIATSGSFNSQLARMQADLATQFSNFPSFIVNGEVRFSGSPSLPATEYMTQYLPSLIDRFAAYVAKEDITLFTSASEVIKNAGDATKEQIREMITGLEAIMNRFGSAIPNLLAVAPLRSSVGMPRFGTDVALAPGREILAARGTIDVLRQVLATITDQNALAHETNDIAAGTLQATRSLASGLASGGFAADTTKTQKRSGFLGGTLR